MTQLNESPIITVERRKAVTIIISAVILSLALGGGLMKVGSGFASRSSDGITVTGSAKTTATADNAVWTLSVSLSSPTVATAVKKVDEMDFTNMRRRNRDNDEKKDGDKAKDSTKTEVSDNPMDDIEIPKEIIVTAWYTPQIPVNQGPGEYWGLPGLILEVSSGRTTILCSKIVINPEEKEEIKVPSKGKEVTQKEYSDIMKKKIEEMQEMYGGRGRGNFRRN